jgi:hypothetical protein
MIVAKYACRLGPALARRPSLLFTLVREANVNDTRLEGHLRVPGVIADPLKLDVVAEAGLLEIGVAKTSQQPGGT